MERVYICCCMLSSCFSPVSFMLPPYFSYILFLWLKRSSILGVETRSTRSSRTHLLFLLLQLACSPSGKDFLEPLPIHKANRTECRRHREGRWRKRSRGIIRTHKEEDIHKALLTRGHKNRSWYYSQVDKNMFVFDTPFENGGESDMMAQTFEL